MPPSQDQSTPALAHRVREILPELPKKQQQVAHLVITDPALVAHSTASAIAELVNVDTATVVRTAQSLGFSGWKDIQAAVRGDVRPQGMFRQRLDVLERLSAEELISDLRQASVTGVSTALGAQQVDLLVEAAAAVATAQEAIIIGGGATAGIATLTASSLRLVAVRAQSVTDPESASTVLPMADATTVVVMFAVRRYLRWLVEASRFTQRQGARLVAVTDGHASPVAFGADISMVAECRPVGLRVTTTGLAAIGHALSALVASERGRHQATLVEASEMFSASAGILQANHD